MTRLRQTARMLLAAECASVEAGLLAARCQAEIDRITPRLEYYRERIAVYEGGGR